MKETEANDLIYDSAWNYALKMCKAFGFDKKDDLEYRRAMLAFIMAYERGRIDGDVLARDEMAQSR